ncbi:hypothetical protein ANCCAN_28762 [Ancylostoma caninum]|uniref:IF rod domain-containing protein n=1 Tax=Ancylostoma caninum TaxID=29170 RepID=A0A368F3N6_ANCCA|nr:hypothetical protein ANCCAN_28762 [Ancylostoma caninum]
MDDIASQRQIFDKETQERHSYERRAVPLLRECEELLKKCRLETGQVQGYSFDDIEKDRKHFRAGVEASMGDIRRQYEILASTVNSEMEQWYKQQINGIDIKRRDDASSYKKKLADLRAELVDVRTKLAHLEERVSCSPHHHVIYGTIMISRRSVKDYQECCSVQLVKLGVIA